MAEPYDPRSFAAESIRFSDDIIRVQIGRTPRGSNASAIGLSQPPDSTGRSGSQESVPPSKNDCFFVSRDVLTKSSKLMQEILADRPITFIRLNVQAEQEDEFLTLAQLYEFGHDLNDSRCMDEAVDAFTAKLKETPTCLPSGPCTEFVFYDSKYFSMAGLRTLIAAAYAMEASEDQLKAAFQKRCERFKDAVATQLVKLRDGQRPRIANIDSCRFHEHADDELCESIERSKKRKRTT